VSKKAKRFKFKNPKLWGKRKKIIKNKLERLKIYAKEKHLKQSNYKNTRKWPARRLRRVCLTI